MPCHIVKVIYINYLVCIASCSPRGDIVTAFFENVVLSKKADCSIQRDLSLSWETSVSIRYRQGAKPGCDDSLVICPCSLAYDISLRNLIERTMTFIHLAVIRAGSYIETVVPESLRISHSRCFHF